MGDARTRPAVCLAWHLTQRRRVSHADKPVLVLFGSWLTKHAGRDVLVIARNGIQLRCQLHICPA